MEEASVVALHVNGNMTLKSDAGLLTGVLLFYSGSCLLDGVILALIVFRSQLFPVVWPNPDCSIDLI